MSFLAIQTERFFLIIPEGLLGPEGNDRGIIYLRRPEKKINILKVTYTKRQQNEGNVEKYSYHRCTICEKDRAR